MPTLEYDHTNTCNGCVDACVRAIAAIGELIFAPTKKLHCFDSHVVSERIIQASKDILRRSMTRCSRHDVPRPHTCDDEPQRCYHCKLPLFGGSCLNVTLCGFHLDKTFSKDPTIWLRLAELPLEAVMITDTMFHEVPTFDEEKNRTVNGPVRVYVRLDGSLFVTRPPIDTSPIV